MPVSLIQTVDRCNSCAPEICFTRVRVIQYHKLPGYFVACLFITLQALLELGDHRALPRHLSILHFASLSQFFQDLEAKISFSGANLDLI